MSNIIGTKANDTLVGTDSADTINGKAGNDTITGNQGDDSLTGGGGKDIFVYDLYDNDGIDTITDFGGVGKATNPTAEVISEVDTIKFQDAGLTARNMLLTQNGTNLEITFEGKLALADTKVILQNFKLEDLENLKASGTRPAIGNILFDEDTSIVDSFNVLDANSTDTSIGIKNTVTFLNDLDNNITGLDNSNDVINGQGGNDKIDGLGGDDLLRGGTGNNTLIGGIGNDTLYASGYYRDEIAGFNYYYVSGNNSLNGNAGDDYLSTNFSTGNNTLNGGAGSDTLYTQGSKGNNLLFGGDGNDILNASYFVGGDFKLISSSGTNTLNGGAGDDTLRAESSEGNSFLSGDDGNDYLSSSGYDVYRSYYSFSSSGNSTLNGGVGDDTLLARYSTGNNLLSGGDGNDYLSVSGDFFAVTSGYYNSTSGNNTLNGGAGNDTLRAEYTTGNNLLSSGDGNDSFYVRTSSPDIVLSSFATQTVDGGKGDDLLSVDYTDATGAIATTFNATTNIGEITAGKYRVSYKNIERLNIVDTVYDDNIVGNNGNDTLSTGSGGKDTIDGGKGEDLLRVNYSNAPGGITSTFNVTTNVGSVTEGTYRVSYKNIERLNVTGTDYNDSIVGSNGNDTLSTGYGGKDTIDGGKGDDLLSVDYTVIYSNNPQGITSTFSSTTNTGEITEGTSRVSYKNIERLHISGREYNDYIVGSNGNDTLDGGYSGSDTIIGGAGNDTLIGGNANDKLYGGSGIDTFVFNSLNEGVDRIYDFNATNEVIQISVDFSGGLSTGVLKASQFTIGTSATTGAQKFIYNSTTGALFFDSDGSAGAFGKVQFAQLSTGLSLTNNNFVVV
nr:calcium-binding protein [Nostoc sp. DedSLP05]